MKKWNKEKVKTVVEQKGYVFIDQPISNLENKITISDSNGYLYHVKFHHFRNDHKPMFVSMYNRYSIQNIKLWLKLNKKPFTLISGEFISAASKMIFKCTKAGCGEEFTMPWTQVYSGGHNCPYCRGSRVGLSNCLATKHPELIKEWHPTKNSLTPYDVTCGSDKIIWWVCSINHRHIWKTRVDHRCRMKSGCPHCLNSKGELIIEDFLFDKDIKHNPQQTFKDLIGLGGGLLSYDFYLPEYNMLIEYQGIQHYEAIDFKGYGEIASQKQFKKQQEHDRLKREYAKNNNIKLLEIPYWDFDNIEKILNKELSL
jgi:hypothetical protein